MKSEERTFLRNFEGSLSFLFEELDNELYNLKKNWLNKVDNFRIFQGFDNCQYGVDRLFKCLDDFKNFLGGNKK